MHAARDKRGTNGNAMHRSRERRPLRKTSIRRTGTRGEECTPPRAKHGGARRRVQSGI